MKIFNQFKTSKTRSQVNINLSKKDLEGTDTMVKRLVACAKYVDQNDGDFWYEDAYSWCEKVSHYYNCSVETVATLVAIYSPTNRWENNKQNVLDALENFYLSGEVGRVGIYRSHDEKAQLFLSEGKVTFGQKTRNFFLNIMGYECIPTIDSIAAAVAIGLPTVHGSYSLTNAAYRALQIAYIQAAKQVGMTPARLQARLWVWARSQRKSGAYPQLSNLCKSVVGEDVATHRLLIKKYYEKRNFAYEKKQKTLA